MRCLYTLAFLFLLFPSFSFGADGYFNVSAPCSRTTSVGDSVSVFCGTNTNFATNFSLYTSTDWNANGSWHYATVDTTIESVSVLWKSAVGTSEAISVYINVNGSTTYLGTTQISLVSTSSPTVLTTSISLNAGDRYALQFDTPVWATNPTSGSLVSYSILHSYGINGGMTPEQADILIASTGSLNFGLMIVVVILTLFVIHFFYKISKKKRPWEG